MSVSPARSQTTSQGSFRLRIGLPLTLPGMTKGLSGTRGTAARTPAASGESEIVRGPVLVSGNRSSLASKSTSSQRRLSISPFRHPVSRSRADSRHRVDRNPLAGLRLGEHPAETPELLPGQEPLAGALTVLDHQPARVVVLGDQSPLPRGVVDPRERVHHAVRHERRIPKLMVQPGHMGAFDRKRGHFAEGGQDVFPDGLSVHLNRLRLTAHRDVFFEIRPASSATRGPSAGGSGTGSSPALIRAMMSAARRLASSAVTTPWRPTVTRFAACPPARVCTT